MKKLSIENLDAQEQHAIAAAGTILDMVGLAFVIAVSNEKGACVTSNLCLKHARDLADEARNGLQKGNEGDLAACQTIQ